MGSLDLRSFAAGALSMLAVIAIGTAIGWLTLRRPLPDVDKLLPRSPQDAALYDLCLAQNGNTVQCDATMRIIERQRAVKAAAAAKAVADVDHPFATIMGSPVAEKP